MTCTTLADLISIILCKHNITHAMNWQLAANHKVAFTPMSNEVNTLDNTEELRRLSDREIEHLIELWRQEECL